MDDYDFFAATPVQDNPETTKDIYAGCEGWVVLPCFKVKIDGDGEAVFVGGNIAGWIFEHIFIYFWTGKVYLRRKN